MTRTLSMPFALFIIVCAGCSSHHLEKYDFQGAGFLYRSTADPAAGMVHIHIEGFTDTPHPVVAAAAGIGSNILSEEARQKLDRAVRPAGVAAAVAKGVERTVNTYMGGRTVPALEDDPRFIVETVLRSCEIRSLASGLFLHVSAKSTIIDRATGRCIWDEVEASSVPLRYTPGGDVPVALVRTAASIYNAVEFFKLTEGEIQDAVLEAAGRVGDRIGEELRDDYADSRGD
ncbi:MAG: hypothetical protein QHI48_01900 [Bacteroidota bacterium]|nr:hypothetical protein [Bacteroidota bacterium]